MSQEQDGSVIRDAWEMYVMETEEGTPCFVSFDLEAAQEDLSATLRHCARVSIALKDPSEEGLPSQQESDRQYGLEDALCGVLAAAKVPCRLVARLTHSGTRELVFQTDDRKKFMATLESWAKGLEGEDVSLEEHEGWEYFDDVVRPGPDEWSWIADRRAVEALLEAGSDPNKLHQLEYVFVGEEPKLEKVRETLAKKGYEHVSGPEEGALVMATRCRLDLDTIVERTLDNRMLAEANEVDCDGWGAAVIPQAEA